ncbi:11353_t:CDS:2 [Funneliformis mosseae]|uniref:11353_t:CDS:1 n=1 Tax=Funneliformis mosseae TaxID=27381 RepID=A0A9N9C0T9_FUNMO|nr:11353_t:CDS:2 [Funneliformis mosseae]
MEVENCIVLYKKKRDTSTRIKNDPETHEKEDKDHKQNVGNEPQSVTDVLNHWLDWRGSNT